MNFLCIYLDEKWGGVALVYVYVLEPRVSLNYRIAWWVFTKLFRDKVLMIPPHICIDFWAKSAKGRIQGRAIIDQWGALLRRTLQQQTEYMEMIWKHLGRCVDIFGIKFLTYFGVVYWT